MALTKVDVLSLDERESVLARFRDDTGLNPLLISAAAGEGLTSLVGALSRMIDKIKDSADER